MNNVTGPGGPPNPFKECYFHGAAILLNGPTGPSECIFTENPATVPTTAEGWLVILGIHTQPAFKTFVKRVLWDEFASNVSNEKEFDTWTQYAWQVKTWDSLMQTLRIAKWTCGKGVGHNFECEENPSSGFFGSKNAWLFKYLGVLLGLVVLASIATCIYVASTPDETREWFEKQKDFRLDRRS